MPLGVGDGTVFIGDGSGAVAHRDLKRKAILWDLATGKAELGPFPAHGARVTHVEYSSDGRTLLTAAQAGGLRLWNAINGRSMISVPEAESTAAALLAEGDRAIVFWNLTTGDLERHPAPPLTAFDRPRR